MADKKARRKNGSIEYLAIVNKKDNVIGKAPKPEVYKKKLVFRAIRVFIISPKNEFLLIKRMKGKIVYPDCWEMGVSGTVKFSETYKAAAVREIKEELGITKFSSKKFSLKPLKKIWVDEDAKIERLFCYVYLLIHDGTLKLQESEVQEIKFVPYSRMDDFAIKNKMHYTNWLHFKKMRKEGLL